MANTVVITHLKGPGANMNGEHVMHVHLISDGSNQTNTVIFDNNDAGYGINNVNAGTILEVRGGGKCSGAIRLSWDQGTDFKALSYNVQDGHRCFRDIGGIQNPAGSGAVGDVLLTTTGLASGDEFDLMVTVKV